VSLKLHELISTAVSIESIDILRWQNRYFVRSRSTDGAEGLVLTNGRLAYLWPIFKALIAPYFIGRDARDLEAMLDEVYTYRSNYKLAGVAFWNCVGDLEMSLFDLLGKVAGQPVGALLGGVQRTEIPVYLSSMRRDTTPEAEVEFLVGRLAETGANAVKIKIGGRMSYNADAAPYRTEQLIALARKTLGDDIAIYADANGSYDWPHAIQIGQLLQAHNIGFFEEPCPFQDYWATRRVADALTMPVSGGEQDTSLPQFGYMLHYRVVDLIQPDLIYNGGFIRTLRVAAMAQEEGVPITPHNSKSDANAVSMLHFASVVPNIGPHQEFNAVQKPGEGWYTPHFKVENGVVQVPTGPGLGIQFDPAIMKEAEIL
jgi:L-alanine-DL-glutamate epimerase-like enolase superfamily enzyme